jgi:hypothetical protein
VDYHPGKHHGVIEEHVPVNHIENLISRWCFGNRRCDQDNK